MTIEQKIGDLYNLLDRERIYLFDHQVSFHNPATKGAIIQIRERGETSTGIFLDREHISGPEEEYKILLHEIGYT